MKKSIILITMLPLVLAGCGKSKNDPKSFTYYNPDGTLSSKRTYTYKNGLNAEILEEEFGEGENSAFKNVLSYNGKLPIKSESYEKVGEDWVLAYVEYDSYDSRGNLVCRYDTYIDENKKEVPFNQFVSVFDANNNEIVSETYWYGEYGFALDMRIEREFNDKNQVVKEKIYNGLLGEFGLFSINLYAYNDSGTLNAMFETDPEGDAYSVTRYGNNETIKKVTEEIFYLIEDGEEFPRTKEVYEYNADANIEKESHYFYDSDTSQFVLEYYGVYEY